MPETKHPAMNPRDTAIEALEKMNALVERMQNVMADHLPPDGTSEQATISELIELLDGPDQRAAQEQVRAALTALKSLEGQASTPRLTVDDAMEVVSKWFLDNGLDQSKLDEDEKGRISDLRTLLTKAAKP